MKPESLLQNPVLVTNQKLTVGCPILDHFLGGGIPCNSVTEIVGESGSGKTQLCLQLLLSALLPNSLGGLSSSSLFLHSELPFPSRRLRQLSLLSPLPDPCDRILVHAVHSAHHLLDVLDRLDVQLTNAQTPLPIKLIVIDSIAGLFRSEFENNPSDLKRRSSLFFKISGKLKSQAKRFGIAVVVTNQVGDLVGTSGDNDDDGIRIGNMGRLVSSGRRVCPALGLSWGHCVNSRLFLSRSVEKVNDDQLEGSDGFGATRTKRRINVVFAPHLPDSSCEFVVVTEGVFGVQS